LNVTNPSKTDFIEFASTHIKKKYPDLNFKPESNATDLENNFRCW
jgi:disulfide oxidoreductase YuzD